MAGSHEREKRRGQIHDGFEKGPQEFGVCTGA